jgi:hypothetical protein
LREQFDLGDHYGREVVGSYFPFYPSGIAAPFHAFETLPSRGASTVFPHSLYPNIFFSKVVTPFLEKQVQMLVRFAALFSRAGSSIDRLLSIAMLCCVH